MIRPDNPMKEITTEIKRLNQEVEGLRADLRAVNAAVASNANDTARLLRNFLERSADSRDEIQYRRDFVRAVNNLRQIEASSPVVDEIKRLNQKVEGLRAELCAANAQLVSNTNDTTRELRRINATGIKVQA